ncbi:unnamed protein product, partial [Vitis vinifera]|uniref:Uncharacterized protein n=1 Tax=Vitis vinifera TaxID=29760 RepID=D7UCA4_VITVI
MYEPHTTTPQNLEKKLRGKLTLGVQADTTRERLSILANRATFTYFLESVVKEKCGSFEVQIADR